MKGASRANGFVPQLFSPALHMALMVSSPALALRVAEAVADAVPARHPRPSGAGTDARPKACRAKRLGPVKRAAWARNRRQAEGLPSQKARARETGSVG